MRLPRGQSAFLWGPRKTGKTTYLRDRFPVEVKLTERLDAADLWGLKAFMEEHRVPKGFVVSNEPRARRLAHRHAEIDVLPWRGFLERLWAGDVVK